MGSGDWAFRFGSGLNGCPYRLAAFSTAPGFDIQAWLPGDVMARFFQAT